MVKVRKLILFPSLKMTNKKFDKAFDRFADSCDAIIQIQIAKDGYTFFGKDPLKIKEGNRFIKLYSNTTSEHNHHDYYFAIVDKENGDVYRPTGEGSITKDSKHQGNIFDENNGLKYITFRGVEIERKFNKLKKEEKYPYNMNL